MYQRLHSQTNKHSNNADYYNIQEHNNNSMYKAGLQANLVIFLMVKPTSIRT